MADDLMDAGASGDPQVKTAIGLRQELEELERQQQQINERLRSSYTARRFVRGVGRGGGSGGANRGGGDPCGSGPPLRPAAGRWQRGVVRTFEEADIDEQPPPPQKKRLLSAVVKVNKEEDSDNQDSDAAEKIEEENQPNSIRPGRTWLRENSRNYSGHKKPAEELSEPVPRVLPAAEDPGLARRNRRMFGSLLLGTLEKFKQENQKLQGSEAFLRRSHSLRRAEQKKTEESERLRQLERQELEDRRRKDLTLRASLAAKAEEKQLELLYLEWASHHERLSTVLRTRSQPSVFFQPARACEATDARLEEQLKELEDWRHQRRAEMKEHTARVQFEYLSNVEMELERWKAGENSKNIRRPQKLPSQLDSDSEVMRGQEHDRKIKAEEEDGPPPSVQKDDKEVEAVSEPTMEEVEEGEDVLGVAQGDNSVEGGEMIDPDLPQEEERNGEET